jgi:hypothetical protein
MNGDAFLAATLQLRETIIAALDGKFETQQSAVTALLRASGFLAAESQYDETTAIAVLRLAIKESKDGKSNDGDHS